MKKRHNKLRAATAVAAMAGVFLLCSSQSASAQETHKTKSGVLITDWSFNPRYWDHGMTVHRFEIENAAPTRKTVRISMPFRRYSGDGLSEMTASVALEGGAKATVAMPQPPVNLAGSSLFSVQISGVADKESFKLAASDIVRGYYNHKELPTILLSRSLSAEAISAAMEQEVEKIVSPTRSGSSEKLGALRLARAPQAWPASWLDYSPFDACLVDADDYKAMPQEVRMALMDYARAGGMLAIVGADALPAGMEAHPDYTNSRDVQIGAAAFGVVAAVPERNIAAWTPGTCTALFSQFKGASQRVKPTRSSSWKSSSSSATIDECMEAIPLGTALGVPVNFTIFLLLAFAIIAGPVAVVATARRNKRTWLLWIVPAFSLAFSAVIFFAMLISEGVTPTQRRQAVTLLDQDARHATTFGAVGVYSPTTLRNGISFEYGTEITPIPYTALSDAVIAFERRQRYLGGWAPPRMAAFFALRRSERRAERLVVEQGEDGAVSVVNALGAPVEWLRLYDAAGNLHVAENIAAGAKATLKRMGASRKSSANAIDVYTHAGWVKRALASHADVGWSYNEIAGGAAGGNFSPEPRTYVAKLSGCPFIEDTLEGRKAKGTAEAIVCGKFGNHAEEDAK